MSQLVSLLRPLEGIDERIAELVDHDIPAQVAAKTPTLWGPEATAEASIRLGWTADPSLMSALVTELTELREHLAHEGVSRVILCGMGGSSLAPEVMAKREGVSLEIVDSTHPDQVARSLGSDLSDAVVVVASKSGTTVETATARASFQEAFRSAGIDPLERVIIVTDPGSPLHKEASEAGHRVFLADPEVGGRFSALTAFGLVPTTLAGVDTKKIVDEALNVWGSLQESSADNPGVVLGAALSDPRRDFALLLADELNSPGLGDWIEQLVAESTGKEGKGVLPVVAQEGAPELTLALSDLVSIALAANPASDADVALSAPLGAQFLLWEYATAFCGYLLKLNPFDQPDVESAKVAARGLLESQPSPQPADVTLGECGIWLTAGLNHEIASFDEAWDTVMGALTPSGYLAVQLYSDRLAHSDMDSARAALVSRCGRPVTIGFGPRFLHSTGQFHKGGAPDGVFVQIIVEPTQSIDIPGYPFDFGTLVNAQAQGDRDVLISRGRPVLTIRVPSEETLLEFLAAGGRH